MRYKREKLKQAIHEAFPDHSAGEVNDELIDMIESLVVEDYSEFFSGGLPRELNHPSSDSNVDDEFTYYRVEAIHSRVGKSSPYEEFVGHLWMVRFSLPEQDGVDFDTKIGKVLLKDRLRPNLVDFNDFVSDKITEYVPERVDLITPTRVLGARFSPGALYLGYKIKTDTQPSFWVIEAGTAFGWPMIIYKSPPGESISMDDTIISNCGYAATPFSHSENIYNLSISPEGSDPGTVTIHSTKQGESSPYISVYMKFIRETVVGQYSPAKAAFEAVCRVAAIAEKMGEGHIALNAILARIARNRFSWSHKPKKNPAR